MVSSDDDDDGRLDVSPSAHQRCVTAFAASKALRTVSWLAQFLGHPMNIKGVEPI